MNELALDPSIRLNRQLEELLQLMKVFSYNHNFIDNHKVRSVILEIEASLKQVKTSKANSDHCHRLLSKVFSLMHKSHPLVDSVTFLDNKLANNVVPIRSSSIDLADISFDRILEASDALNSVYVGSHFDESLETYLTEPIFPQTHIKRHKKQQRHLIIVSSRDHCLSLNPASKIKPKLDLKKGK